MINSTNVRCVRLHVYKKLICIWMRRSIATRLPITIDHANKSQKIARTENRALIGQDKWQWSEHRNRPRLAIIFIYLFKCKLMCMRLRIWAQSKCLIVFYVRLGINDVITLSPADGLFIVFYIQNYSFDSTAREKRSENLSGILFMYGMV